MQNSSSSSTDIIHLNVGGQRFCTSRQTLTWVTDSFFSSMVSGRISSHKDETGAIFIDRDPVLFGLILNYLRTKEIQLSNVDLYGLKHEAEFYGITPLVRRLLLCEELEQESCGGVLFHGIISPPRFCNIAVKKSAKQIMLFVKKKRRVSDPPFPANINEKRQSLSSIDAEIDMLPPRPSESNPTLSAIRRPVAHCPHNESRPNAPISMSDLRCIRGPVGGSLMQHPLRVTMVKGHFNWLAVAYPHFVSLYRLKESVGWNLSWVGPYLDQPVENIALNAKNPGQEGSTRMVAASYGRSVQLWQICDNGQKTREVGIFNLSVGVSSLFFIGCHLVALSKSGKFGVWHATTQNWQVQDVVPITSYDTTGSLLLLGCDNGCISIVDMQKFPLRMKDNDLLVTELFKDPAGDCISSLSVYLTPKTNLQQCAGFGGSWMEIAYGTNAGMVRVIVLHPETLGQGPQLFQTFTVHCSPVTKVMISEKHLVSVCSDYNHVRTWSVTRFRGMISTQPGSMPLASFKIFSIEESAPPTYYACGNDIGPFGEKDDQQVFVQKIVPETDQLFVRLSSTGKRVCVLKSVDGSVISAFGIHECEGSSRMGSRPRRYIFTGHCNGTIQIWDLSTALDLASKGTAIETGVGGPTAAELVHLVDQCDLTNSRATTPSVSPSPLLMASGGQSQYTPQALRRQLLSIHSESVVSIPENVELNDSLGLEKSESTSETDSLAKFKS